MAICARKVGDFSCADVWSFAFFHSFLTGSNQNGKGKPFVIRERWRCGQMIVIVFLKENGFMSVSLFFHLFYGELLLSFYI
jgi:hypothetical protein